MYQLRNEELGTSYMTAKASVPLMPLSAGDIITISLARNGPYAERAEPALKENRKGFSLPLELDASQSDLV